MAYDPYSTGQYDYYQDPYQGGADYGYGYGVYGYAIPYDPSPPPPPDKNWVDPVKVVREYLKKIQKSCIHKGFEGLKENGLFLFEVAARSISLHKYTFENLVSKENTEKPIKVFVKFLDTNFVEINENEKAFNSRSSGEHRTISVLSNRTSFTNLFQNIYSTTGDHDSLLPEIVDGTESKEQTVDESKETASFSSEQENVTETYDANDVEMETIKIMKGKSVLLPMSGLSIIQKLQQYPLVLKVTQRKVSEEDTEIEGDIVATSFIRYPETFRKAVLVSCKPDSILPVVVVTTSTHKLMDSQGWEVGQAELTLVLTCFGKGAVNCVSEIDNIHNYDHTFLLRNLKAKHIVPEESLKPTADPRLAKDIIKLGLFYPSNKTSSEILQQCVSANLVPTDEEERKHAQKKKDCVWFHMVKKANPSSSHSFDFEKYKMEMEMERAALWMKHKKICRDLKGKDPVFRSSLLDRFKELQIVGLKPGVGETQSSLENVASKSISEASSQGFGSLNISVHGSLKK